MPATRGPLPKRTDQRRRRNTPEKPITTVSPPAAPVAQPALGFPAHPVAEAWYRSLAVSGQAVFFEPSDWQAARVVAFDLTRHLNSRRVSAQMLAAVWSAMGELLTTEASRRRVHIEIQRHACDAARAEAAKVAVLDAYRRAVGAPG